jgi:hypothetical protein
MGGAIVAAPVTLPLLYVALRRPLSRRLRATAVVVAGLTAAEVAWAVTYLAVEEAQPWIWLLPLAGGLTVAAAFARPRLPAAAGQD